MLTPLQTQVYEWMKGLGYVPTQKEICKQFHMERSNAYRMLQTLVRWGYVEYYRTPYRLIKRDPPYLREGPVED